MDSGLPLPSLALAPQPWVPLPSPLQPSPRPDGAVPAAALFVQQSEYGQSQQQRGPPPRLPTRGNFRHHAGEGLIGNGNDEDEYPHSGSDQVHSEQGG